MSDNKIDKTKIDVADLTSNNEEQPTEKKKRKIPPKAKNIFYIVLLLVITAVALVLSLYGDFDGIVSAITSADWRWLLLIAGLVLVSYMIEALIILVFCRLYTRNYHYHQAMATAMIGAFYSAVTPASSGGQIMQVYTMKKQGMESSNSASILIMMYIVYQSALIVLGAIAVFFKWEMITQMGEIWIGEVAIPIIPFTIFGFVINIMVILGLFLMSYSRAFHNFILHYIIDFLAKIKLVRNPDKTRESLRVQVENFKIELRRLFSNVPVFILVFLLYTLILIIRFSIPYFAGFALDGFSATSIGQKDVESFFQAVILSAYHQMTSGLIPLPGAAGASEYLFQMIFANYYASSSITAAAQIIWRFMTFHIVVLVSGIIAATYRSSPKGQIEHANRATFVTLQLETYELRKATSDTLYKTAQLSRKEIQDRLKKKVTPKKKRAKTAVQGEEPENGVSSVKNGTSAAKKNTSTSSKKGKKNKDDDNIDIINLGE